MAWPASQKTLRDALDSTNNVANRVKSEVLALRNLSAAGPVVRNRFRALQLSLDRAIDTWDENAALPGIVAYARAQFDLPLLDVPAEFNTMRAGAVALRDWIHANYSTDTPGSGADLSHTTDAEGNKVDLTFSSAQLAGFRVEADAFLATIG